MTPDARIARRARSMLIRQINNVLCFFRNLNHVTKIQLLISYCYSLYGCVLWDMACSDIEMVLLRGARVFDEFGACLAIHTVLSFL